jgi:putative transcriptional regulator
MAITLKAARVNAGLSQSEAAKRLKVSESTLSKWEIGKTFPNVRHILDIEKIYGMPFDEIVFLPNATVKP